MQQELFRTPQPAAKCPPIWELLDQDQKRKLVITLVGILQKAIVAEKKGAINER
jgi:hypothetical protein